MRLSTLVLVILAIVTILAVAAVAIWLIVMQNAMCGYSNSC